MCLLLVSCSQQPTNTCEVTGLITYKGTPLTGGTIYFRSADLKPAEEGGKFGQAEIQSDGTYETHSLLPGPMVVTVEVTDSVGKVPKDAKMPPGFEKQAHHVKIPPKYASPKTSGLTYEVKPGKQTKDFELN
jgi:hypothetical protein